MRWTLTLVLAAALVVIAAAVGFVATTEPPSVSAPAPADTARVASPPAARGGASDAGPLPRAGRRLSLDEAIRELDLIRPSRQRQADDFTVPTAGGESFRLSAHRGKVVLLNFWATWCPPCLEEMPALERLYRQQRDAGLVLVALSVDTDPARVTPFVREHGLSFLIGLDPRVQVADRYGVRALPSTFVIDPEGNLAALALGPRVWDNDAAHSLVERLAR